MRKGSGEDYYQISIRFLPDEYKQIHRMAKENGRSFSKEVTKLVKAQLALESKKES